MAALLAVDRMQDRGTELCIERAAYYIEQFNVSREKIVVRVKIFCALNRLLSVILLPECFERSKFFTAASKEEKVIYPLPRHKAGR